MYSRYESSRLLLIKTINYAHLNPFAKFACTFNCFLCNILKGQQQLM